MDFWQKTELMIKTIDKIINANLHKKFVCFDNNEYQKLIIKNPSKASQIYWKEILDRAYLASLITILRNRKWIKGIHIGMENQNIFVFSASVRSLIESIADSIDALVLSSHEISKLHALIFKSLSGEAGNFLYQNKPLEDTLIHFLYARKLRGEDAPDSHRAKNPRDYLNIFKDTDIEKNN